MKKTQVVQIIKEVLAETIKKVGKDYVVYPEKGGKRLGTHPTRSAAEKQLTAIHLNKEMVEYVKPANPEDVDPEELKVGTEHELEHTRDVNKARIIALQHLAEDPKYYTKLQKSGIK